MKLLLFDFDGTLIRGDSFVRLLVFSKGWPGFFLKMPVVFWRLGGLFFVGKFSAETAKAAILAAFFLNEKQADLEKLGRDFCRKMVPGLLNSPVFDQAKTSRAAGHRVVVVSASGDFWLRPFCETHGFDLICTEMAWRGGRFAGHFSTPNCNGPEKARRVMAFFGSLDEFENVQAWGNSSGDAAMFALADESFKIS